MSLGINNERVISVCDPQGAHGGHLLALGAPWGPQGWGKNVLGVTYLRARGHMLGVGSLGEV